MIKANKGIVEIEGTTIELIAEIGTCCKSIISESLGAEEIKKALLSTVILALWGGENIKSHYEKATKLSKFIEYKMKEGEENEI